MVNAFLEWNSWFAPTMAHYLAPWVLLIIAGYVVFKIVKWVHRKRRTPTQGE